MKTPDIPPKYERGWLDGLDSRYQLVRELRDRFDTVCDDLGGKAALSYMQRSLVERSLWLERFLSQQEQRLAIGEEFNAAVWIQAANSLQGIYKTLGLERKARTVSVGEWLRQGTTEVERS